MLLSGMTINEELAGGHIEIDPLYEWDIPPPRVGLRLDRRLPDFNNARGLHADVNNDVDDPSGVAEIKNGEPCRFSGGFSIPDVPGSRE